MLSLAWHAGLQCQEVWSIQIFVPASKEDVFSGCEGTSAECRQQQRMWWHCGINNSQAGCCVMCLWAALIHQIICSKLRTPRQCVPESKLHRSQHDLNWMGLTRDRINNWHEARAMACPRERRWSTILCASGNSLSAVDAASGLCIVVAGSTAVAAPAASSVSSVS